MPSDHTPARPLRILVTGAAGLIGRGVCAALAGRGHAVAGLLRRRDAGAPEPADLAAGTVVLVEGDVAEPSLGLEPAMAGRLAVQLDVIVHCAALTGFNLAASAYDRVNRGGTAQVLAFAARLGAARSGAPVPLLHVSTAFVCGAAEGTVPEAPLTTTRFNNGYEASKQAAEALVTAARLGGQPVAVARPSIVVGNWADGHTDAFGNLYQLIRLVAEGRLKVLPVADGASLDLVPLDHVVGGLVDITERMTEADGRVFHLASGRPVPITALSRVALAFPQIRPPRFVSPETFDPAQLSPRERRLHEQVVTAYAAYLRPSPQFVVEALQRLSFRRCPPVDDALLHRLIAFAVSAGFLPGEAGAVSHLTSG